MTTPTVATPTQVSHPWRAVARTILAALVALLPVLPAAVEQLGITTLPGVAGVLAVAAAITRVLAIPAVDAWLRAHVSWLAASPRSTGATAATSTPTGDG